jgi:hypothetical protein
MRNQPYRNDPWKMTERELGEIPVNRIAQEKAEQSTFSSSGDISSVLGGRKSKVVFNALIAYHAISHRKSGQSPLLLVFRKPSWVKEPQWKAGLSGNSAGCGWPQHWVVRMEWKKLLTRSLTNEY